MSVFDALIVLNQAEELSRVVQLCRSAGHRSILVLTTHWMFEPERERLVPHFERCEIKAVAELLDDAEMEECDREAEARLLPSLTPSSRAGYAQRFFESNVYFKNAAAYRRLSASHRWHRIYFSNGLGISDRFWREQGGRPLSRPGFLHGLRRLAARHRSFAKKLRFLCRSADVHLLDENGKRIVFLSIRRLKFAPGSVPSRCAYPRSTRILGALRRLTLDPVKLLLDRFGQDTVVATTIHEYPAFLTRAEHPVLVFVDGFHPSNYTRSYIEQYGKCRFVTADRMSVEWFLRHGREVDCAPSFLSRASMKAPTTRRASTVVLALNHAGDWTALINRSDTDLLVHYFCECARRFPKTAFVVRPHPTMDHRDHEGTGARRRIESFVESLALPNLSVSKVSLEDDLERGDVFVSEYSQVLIDALRLGRLGIIANFTGRRSFMIDYERCGFLSADTPEALCALIEIAEADPGRLASRQTEAVERYNRELESFTSRAVEPEPRASRAHRARRAQGS